MKYKLTHKTTYYTYTDAIHNYQCIVCLHPITSERQNCEDFKLTIEPNPQNLFARTDYFGNTQYYFSILKPQKFCKLLPLVLLPFFS
jgi:transglutaminase-like putative cysteine protease